MKRAIPLLVALGGVAVTGVALVSSGAVALPGQQASTHPPCAELPTPAAVTHALGQHTSLVKQLQGIGTQVSVGTPCDGQPDKALVLITYKSAAQQDGIVAIMNSDGFGVPAQSTKA